MNNTEKPKKKRNDASSQANIINAGLNQEVINRYGTGVKEHWASYSGVDNDLGIHYKRGLKDIAKSKVNPQYHDANIKQQAGFSAEVKETARTNAENAINGKGNRKMRTDDMGSVNDPLYDHVEVDANGNPIPGSGTQMKFVGKNPRECLEKLMSKKYQKYRDNNVPFDVPSDYYDGVQQEIDKEIQKAKQQIEHAKTRGDRTVAEQKQNRLKELRKLKGNVNKSKVSSADAKFAREHPFLSAAQDIHNVSHRAGMEGLKTGAMVGGGMAGIRNMVDVLQGKKTPAEAAKDIAMTTATAGAVGYGTNYLSTALKGTLQNSGNAFIRTLSKTNLPAAAVSTIIDSKDAIWDYVNGRIDGTECLKRVGKSGANTMMTMSYAAAGQALIPIPIVGGLIGGMVGYTLTSSIYSGLMKQLEATKHAKEEQKRIEAECREAIKAMRAYRQEIERITRDYMADYQSTFDRAFVDINRALQLGDADGFIGGVNQITRKLGGKPQFETVEESNQMILNHIPLEL